MNPARLSVKPAERLVTAYEIAQMLSVSPKWVYSACRLYGLPYYQIGRYKRFSPSQVFEWLEESGPIIPTEHR